MNLADCTVVNTHSFFLTFVDLIFILDCGMHLALRGLNKTLKMKKINLIITAIAVAIGFSACTTKDETTKQDVETLSVYVDSVETASTVYTKANWDEIEAGYNARMANADKAMDKMEAAEKERVEASKVKFATLRSRYEIKLKEGEMVVVTPPAGADYRLVLRNKLFGEGKIGADMKFNSITAQNILGVYDNFVNTVATNKDSYTREDWDEIKVLYEGLDSRKNEVEKDLKSADNRKIAGLKVRFATLKATNRVSAKAKENDDSKQ